MDKQQKQSTASVESTNEGSQENLHRQCWGSKFWCKKKSCLLGFGGANFLLLFFLTWLIVHRPEKKRTQYGVFFDVFVIIFCVLSLLSSVIFAIFGVFKEKLWACVFQVISEIIQICVFDLACVIYFIASWVYGDSIPFVTTYRPQYTETAPNPVLDIFCACLMLSLLVTAMRGYTVCHTMEYLYWIGQKLQGEDIPDDTKVC